MATQGTPLRDVNVIGAPLQTVKGVPVGALHDVFILTRATLSRVESTNYTNRFPTPPSAFGFLVDPRDVDGELAYGVDGLESPYILAGALSPQGTYLEPTTGQIWPRIG